jgi:hypothetical protein
MGDLSIICTMTKREGFDSETYRQTFLTDGFFEQNGTRDDCCFQSPLKNKTAQQSASEGR